jgi:hypothetical protein
MTKLETKYKTALGIAMDALNYYSTIPKHIDHDQNQILVGTCKRCEHNMNQESVAKTALHEIKSLDI